MSSGSKWNLREKGFDLRKSREGLLAHEVPELWEFMGQSSASPQPGLPTSAAHGCIPAVDPHRGGGF